MMNLLTIISAISAIASILLLVFDVEEKVKIALKQFLLLLSILCFLFFLIASFISKANGKDNQESNLTGAIGVKTNSDDLTANDSSSNGRTDNDSSSNDGAANDSSSNDGAANDSSSNDGAANDLSSNDRAADDSSDRESPGEREEIDDGAIEQNNETGIDEGILKIDSIMPNTYTAIAIEDVPSEIQPNEIIVLPGKVSGEGQSIDYEYVPLVSGTYRFEFSNVPNGTDFRLWIYNSGWEKIKSDYDLDNGDGLTASLNAGELYYIRVEQYRGLGPYTLNIGQKKVIVDITGFTAVSDSIQYTSQENDYAYVAGNSGTHRFEFSNVPNGTDFRLWIYNSGWEKIKSDYDLDNGDGLTASLNAGELYYIRVEQYRGLGTYTLNIGPKKEIVDLTNYTAVSDSIQYTAQINNYSYVAGNDGTYRFEFSNVPNGTDFRLWIYNSGWEKIKSDYNLDNGDGLTQQLTAGETYYICVEQYRGLGLYTLNIGQKKAAADITDFRAVSDSIQYTDQKNDYSFTPKLEGTYIFTFSNVSEGNSFRLGVFNSGWEKLKEGYNFGNNEGVEVFLSAGESYFIQAAQYDGCGNYTLTVEFQ
ncbi:MAG: hypothetical protein NC433_07675 [Clostridiales bacterium]|nr:hypothetical protein [Clostridiales bacterium]